MGKITGNDLVERVPHQPEDFPRRGKGSSREGHGRPKVQGTNVRIFKYEGEELRELVGSEPIRRRPPARADVRQACLEGWNNQEYDPSETEFLDFPAYGDVRVFLSHFNLLYVVENAVEQQDRAMRRSKKEAYMSLSEYLGYIEKVDRDIRKLPSYRGRPQPTDRGT